MKLIFLIAALGSGGAERVMTTLANKLTIRGHNVSFILFDAKSSFYRLNDNIKVYGIDEMPSAKNKINRVISIPQVEIKRFFKICSIIKKEKPDVVLSFCFVANLMNIFVKYVHRGPKYVVSERNDPTSYNKLVQWVCKKIYVRADALICQSKNVKEYYTNTRKKIVIDVIENPVNEECISDRIATVRKKRFLAVGRLVAQKNFSLLLESFAVVHKKYPEFTLEIYGKGTLEKELLKKVEELGIEQRVFFRGNESDVMKKMYDSWCFVLPSLYEGFPNVLVEAMASGIPVISSDFSTGIARKLIQDSKNGFLFQVDNKNELIEKMVAIIECDNLQSIAEENWKYRYVYSVENIVSKWEEFFYTLLDVGESSI